MITNCLLKILFFSHFSDTPISISSWTFTELSFSVSKCLNVGTSQGLILRAFCLYIYTYTLGNLIQSHCFKNHPHATDQDFICWPTELQTHKYSVSYSSFLLKDIPNLMCTKPNLISSPNKCFPTLPHLIYPWLLSPKC